MLNIQMYGDYMLLFFLFADMTDEKKKIGGIEQHFVEVKQKTVA